VLKWLPVLDTKEGFFVSGTEHTLIISLPGASFYADEARKRPIRGDIKDFVAQELGLEKYPNANDGGNYIVWSSSVVLCPNRLVDVTESHTAFKQAGRIWDWICYICSQSSSKQCSGGLSSTVVWSRKKHRIKGTERHSYYNVTGPLSFVQYVARLNWPIQAS
jgi:hypothetical protein